MPPLVLGQIGAICDRYVADVSVSKRNLIGEPVKTISSSTRDSYEDGALYGAYVIYYKGIE